MAQSYRPVAARRDPTRGQGLLNPPPHPGHPHLERAKPSAYWVRAAAQRGWFDNTKDGSKPDHSGMCQPDLRLRGNQKDG